VNILDNVTSPSDLIDSEIEFFKQFMTGIKLEMPMNKFTKVFS